MDKVQPIGASLTSFLVEIRDSLSPSQYPPNPYKKRRCSTLQQRILPISTTLPVEENTSDIRFPGRPTAPDDRETE